MMNRKMIAGAIVALGLSSVVPSFAMADHWRDDRDRRDYHDYRDYRDRDGWRRDRECRDFDVPVSLRDVPRRVMETFQCEARGARLEGVDHVMRDGHEFYRFRMDQGRGRDFNIRIALNGAVLGIERA